MKVDPQRRCPSCNGYATLLYQTSNWLVLPAYIRRKCTRCSRTWSEEPLDNPCSLCGQIDEGQTGEYPCVNCGLPQTHDALPVGDEL